MRKVSDNPSAPLEIAVLALPGVNAFDLATVAQVFGRATNAMYRVRTVGLQPGAVETTSDYQVLVESSLDALTTAHTVVVPGHALGPVAEPALTALRASHARGARIASICTGAFLLAASGVLSGRRATTHWGFADELRSQHPGVDVVPDKLYLEDGGIWTSGGVAAGIDLCLRLVEVDFGHEASLLAARNMVAPLRRSGDQRQFLPTARAEDLSGRPQLRAAFTWATENLSEEITVADLARRAHQSPRTFSRHVRSVIGTSPKSWLTSQRISRAAQLLEQSDLAVDAIAQQVGMGTGSTLRSQFRSVYGVTPSAYRRAFHP